MNTLHALCIGAALLTWIAAVVSYLQMMRTLPREVVLFHMARLRVRSNLLCLAAPEIFTGAGATWRRCYLGAMLAFLASIASFVLVSMVARV